MTVRNVLDANKGIGPGFHLLRHVLAFAIVLWHCSEVIWYDPNALAVHAQQAAKAGAAVGATVHGFHFSLKDLARPGVHALVGIFFALSGFLVAGSALRTRKTSKFLTNRALRIFPALSVDTLLSALVLGPLVTSLTLSRYFSSPDFLPYFGNIVGWIHYTLPGVFEGNPLPGTINGQLWTLHPEFECYFLMAIAIATGLIKRRGLLLWIGAVSIAAMCAAHAYDPITFASQDRNIFAPWYIVVLFWIGVIAFLHAEKIPLRFSLFAISVVLYWLIVLFDVLSPLAGIPLIYITLFLGMTAFPWWDRLVKSDYSYGIYLYHFPVLQALMWAFGPSFYKLPGVEQLVILLPVALLLAIGLAALSWRFVEKPALRLRTVFARTEPVTGEIPPASAGHKGFAVVPDEQGGGGVAPAATASSIPGGPSAA